MLSGERICLRMDEEEVNTVPFHYFLWHPNTQTISDDSTECVLMHLNDEKSLMVSSTQPADLDIGDSSEYVTVHLSQT